MTINEFKFWLDGFSHCFYAGSPNSAQWSQIKEKIDSLTGGVNIPSPSPYVVPSFPPFDIKDVTPYSVNEPKVNYAGNVREKAL